MKKFTLMFSMLMIGLSAMAAPNNTTPYGSNAYAKPIIFVEGGVEFAVYPDGQFDFFYNPQRSGYGVNIVSPHINISYNSGFNYEPFIQYDDYGAVIQIENVPVYYDFYGRITRAGMVDISYNTLGKIARVGNLYVYYNPYGKISHYNGFINMHNRTFVPRPWHHHYRPPHAQYSVVYAYPYRAHYQPIRVSYNYHINYYQKNYNKGYKKSYYRPGEKAVVYHRGQRTEQPKDIRYASEDSNLAPVRSNQNSVRGSSTTTRVVKTQAAPQSRANTRSLAPQRNKNSYQQENVRRSTATTSRSAGRGVDRAATEIKSSSKTSVPAASSTSSPSRSSRGRG